MLPNSTHGYQLISRTLWSPWVYSRLTRALSRFHILAQTKLTYFNSRSELSRRDEYILSYAEYLHSDPTQWKTTVAYMYTCGDIGRERGDEVLVRVPLRLHPSETPSTSEEAVAQAVKEISEVCFNHQREAVRRTVCRVRSLMKQN